MVHVVRKLPPIAAAPPPPTASAPAEAPERLTRAEVESMLTARDALWAQQLQHATLKLAELINQTAHHTAPTSAIEFVPEYGANGAILSVRAIPMRELLYPQDASSPNRPTHPTPQGDPK